jgi:hypothetical protein
MNYIEKKGSELKIGDIIPKGSLLMNNYNNDYVLLLRDAKVLVEVKKARKQRYIIINQYIFSNFIYDRWWLSDYSSSITLP